MRRYSLAIALALSCAVFAAGCKGSATSSGGAPGVGDGTFTVVVQNGQGGNNSLAITGGFVTSSPAGIDCGVVPHGACSATFTIGTQVELFATPVGTDAALDPDGAGPLTGPANMFLGWAGDCAGEGECKLTGASDKYIVAAFGGERRTHANFSDGAVHRQEYVRFASGTAGALQCTTCHGHALAGLGLAVGCGGCHRNPYVPPLPASPTVTFTPATPAVGVAVQLSALTTDPGGATVSCSWALVAKPSTSAVTLSAGGTCSGTPGGASFTPDVAGVYTVAVDPSNGGGTALVAIPVSAAQLADATIGVGTTAPDAELTAIAGRMKAVLAKGYNNVAPAALAKSLAGLDNANPRTTYAVVDIRLPEDFARGHIPGAVNVPLAKLPDVLLANPFFPEESSYTKKIIVAGYNGGDSTMGAVVFNSARWVGDDATGNSGGTGAAARPAWALKYGMSSWTFDLSASPTRFDNDEDVRRYAAAPQEVSAVPTTPTYAYAAIGTFPGTPSLTQKILVRARTYLQGLMDEAAATGIPAREAMWTTFVKLNALRSDADPANDPQVLDVRSANAYTGVDKTYSVGHVPGAQFVAYQQVAHLTATTTQMIDPGRKVFVYCVTGHTGGHATMALGIMGYQPRNVLYGYSGWVGVTSMMANFDGQADANDFPLASDADCNLLAGMTGTVPATLNPAATSFNSAACQAAYNPSRQGCATCHQNYLAHFIDLGVKPIPGVVVEVASEGEG